MPGEEKRKLLCLCGKLLGTFTRQGLDLYCRFSKETTTVPYSIKSLAEATASRSDAIASGTVRRRGRGRERGRLNEVTVGKNGH